MLFHVSPEDEARALRRAAARAGCRVRSLAIRETSAGARAVGRIDCPDGWAAARMLVASSIEDAQTPGARDLALSLRRDAPSDEAFARAVHAYVKERVAFVREPGEVFQGAGYTLGVGSGDCDDHARAVYAIAVAGGVPATLAFLHHGVRGSQPTHAVAQLCPERACAWAETTVDAAYGEHPLAAATRLRLVSARADLAREVRVMTEKDLKPIPAGFDDANPSDRVALDVAALARLGFIGPELGELGACDEAFRDAVAAFQRATPGLVVDGLIGPHTRAAIASALPPDEFGIGYLAAVGAVPIVHTGDLPDEFFSDMRAYAGELGFDPLWMLDIMWAESGLRPTAKYRHAPNFATGLIGFVNVAGTGAVPDNSEASHDVFATLPATQQLRYARDFWRPMRGRAASGANLYQYNFVPASLDRGTSEDTVIAARGGTGYRGQEDTFYRVNALLDVDGDGTITVGDLAAHLERQKRDRAGNLYARYAEALARLGAPSTPRGGSALGAVAMGLGVVLLSGALTVGAGVLALRAWREGWIG